MINRPWQVPPVLAYSLPSPEITNPMLEDLNASVGRGELSQHRPNSFVSAYRRVFDQNRGVFGQRSAKQPTVDDKQSSKGSAIDTKHINSSAIDSKQNSKNCAFDSRCIKSPQSGHKTIKTELNNQINASLCTNTVLKGWSKPAPVLGAAPTEPKLASEAAPVDNGAALFKLNTGAVSSPKVIATIPSNRDVLKPQQEFPLAPKRKQSESSLKTTPAPNVSSAPKIGPAPKLFSAPKPYPAQSVIASLESDITDVPSPKLNSPRFPTRFIYPTPTVATATPSIASTTVATGAATPSTTSMITTPGIFKTIVSSPKSPISSPKAPARTLNRTAESPGTSRRTPLSTTNQNIIQFFEQKQNSFPINSNNNIIINNNNKERKLTDEKYCLPVFPTDTMKDFNRQIQPEIFKTSYLQKSAENKTNMAPKITQNQTNMAAGGVGAAGFPQITSTSMVAKTKALFEDRGKENRQFVPLIKSRTFSSFPTEFGGSQQSNSSHTPSPPTRSSSRKVIAEYQGYHQSNITQPYISKQCKLNESQVI